MRSVHLLSLKSGGHGGQGTGNAAAQHSGTAAHSMRSWRPLPLAAGARPGAHGLSGLVFSSLNPLVLLPPDELKGTRPLGRAARCDSTKHLLDLIHGLEGPGKEVEVLYTWDYELSRKSEKRAWRPLAAAVVV